MTRLKKNICLLSALLLGGCIFANALNVPSLNDSVTDLADVMSDSQKEAVSSYLNAMNSQSGTQIAILTVPSLDGEAIESYSMRVAENWKLGQKDKDNGVLILLSVAEHKVRIEVGYGLEGDLTDAYCGLIIRKVMIPYFQEDDYANGLAAGVKVIAQKIGAETSDSVVAIQDSGENESEGVSLVTFAFLVIWFLMFTMGLGSRIPFLRILPWVAFAVRHGGNSSHYSGFHSGSGSSFRGFGGGSGGGFSGGGGSFGGGGASGSW